MATMRELKRRINSVQSSQKITGAMKMISSARLRKAEAALNHALPYEEQLQSILNHVNETDCDVPSPLRQEREVKRVAVVVFASDEGLCGSFNLTLYKKLVEVVNAYKATSGVNGVEVYPAGRKIVGEVRRIRGIIQKKAPELFAEKKYPEAVKMLSEELIARFLKNEIDRVDVIYTHYRSRGTQVVKVVQLLPLKPLKAQGTPEQAGPDFPESQKVYIYEPDSASIFEMLYPLIIRTILYKALLENQTSEQAVRILSMQMANDNAIKLLGRLQLEYNKLRQQGITTELLDMAGGAIQD